MSRWSAATLYRELHEFLEGAGPGLDDPETKLGEIDATLKEAIVIDATTPRERKPKKKAPAQKAEAE